MIGKKVRWRMTWYGSDGTPTRATGTVVAEHGDWVVVKTHMPLPPHCNPFATKRMADIELVAEERTR